MPKVQMSCPRCRQPLIAEVEQLFDVGVDPQAKQRFLSGEFNQANCKNCGYQGPLSTPLVYHDPDKELLLTYFPAELGLPLNEQERAIGPYVTQVMNKLPPEKRKAYLLRPQSMLTLQTMIEKVLESDGITREMLDASQKRLNLIQRLVNTPPDVRAEVVKQEESLVDEAFFQMISRLVDASLAGGDQQTARALAQLQKDILPLTETGRRIQAETAEVETAVKALQEASQKGLTRDSLLDLFLQTKSEAAIGALVSMTRQGLDYDFFRILSYRIDAAAAEDKENLTKLREKLMDLTAEIDRRMQAQLKESQTLLEEILGSPNVEKATVEHFSEMDDLFGEVLRAEMEKARKENNLERMGKLTEMITVIQKASAPPAEVELIEKMVSTSTEDDLRQLISQNSEKMTPEFLQMLNGLAAQMDADGQKEIAGRLEEIYKLVLRITMEANLRK